ncbi:MAG TPA: PEP-CTERM sorting domain-containing protein [Opitutaceae bacterium]|nr:PEP-CTERM sorting domain-containing protein [Opitutaceae bacterium]
MNASSRVLASIGCTLAVFFTMNKASAQTPGDVALLASAPSVQLTDNGYTPGFGAGYDVTLSQGTAYAEATVPALQFFNTNNSMYPTLDLYCVEISQYSASGTYQVVPLQNADLNIVAGGGSIDSLNGIATTIGTNPATQTTGIGTDKANKLGLLYAYQFGSTYTPTALTSLQLAAFQLAAWQILESDTFGPINTNTSNNVFTVTPTGATSPGGASQYVPTAISDADSLLNAVALDSSLTAMPLDALHSPTSQDYILPMTSYSQIPEPSTYAAILALAAFGFAVVRRRRRLA